MSDNPIGPDSRVTLHFSLRLANLPQGDDSTASEQSAVDPLTAEDEQLLDSTFDRAPAELVVGDGNLLPGFERRLFGLRAGDRERFLIAPEDGFGHPNPNNIQLVTRASFSNEEDLTIGMVMSFTDASGGEVPGMISGFDGDQVIVDFNHPLAGRNLLFEVEILAVNNDSDGNSGSNGAPIS